MAAYDKVAELFADDPSLAMVRRFGELNALNLLYLLAELVELERDLKRFTKEDQLNSDTERREYRHSWYAFSTHQVDSSAKDENCRQWRTMIKIRHALRLYSMFFD